jgi:AcrR family transcriptional regulator
MATTMPTAETNATVERILEGALRALSRHGLKRLSMGDVSEEAGVSRGTVYRYFSNREQLLDAVGHHVQHGFETGLDRAIAENPDLDVRVEVVFDFLASYSKQSALVRLVELQPGFVLDYLQRQFPEFVKRTGEALRPAFEQAPAVRSGRIDAAFLSKLVQLAMMGCYLLGGTDQHIVAKHLSAIWNVLAHSAP